MEMTGSFLFCFAFVRFLWVSFLSMTFCFLRKGFGFAGRPCFSFSGCCVVWGSSPLMSGQVGCDPAAEEASPAGHSRDGLHREGSGADWTVLLRAVKWPQKTRFKGTRAQYASQCQGTEWSLSSLAFQLLHFHCFWLWLFTFPACTASEMPNAKSETVLGAGGSVTHPQHWSCGAFVRAAELGPVATLRGGLAWGSACHSSSAERVPGLGECL